MCNYVNVYPDRPSTPTSSPKPEPETPEYQRAKHQVKIETARKLRKRGLSDTEIVELLGLSPEETKEIADRG